MGETIVNSVNWQVDVDDCNYDVSIDRVVHSVEVNNNIAIQTSFELSELNDAVVDGLVELINEKNWMDYARGWKETPTLNTTIATGDVYDYVFESDSGDVTYYRLVPSGDADDAFYANFSSGELSGLLAKKEITL